MAISNGIPGYKGRAKECCKTTHRKSEVGTRMEKPFDSRELAGGPKIAYLGLDCCFFISEAKNRLWEWKGIHSDLLLGTLWMIQLKQQEVSLILRLLLYAERKVKATIPQGGGGRREYSLRCLVSKKRGARVQDRLEATLYDTDTQMRHSCPWWFTGPKTFLHTWRHSFLFLLLHICILCFSSAPGQKTASRGWFGPCPDNKMQKTSSAPLKTNRKSCPPSLGISLTASTVLFHIFTLPMCVIVSQVNLLKNPMYLWSFG